MNTDFHEFERRAEQPPHEGWHLKKEVNLSIIISLVVVGFSCVAGYFDLKKDIELLKQNDTALALRDQGIDASTKESIRALTDRLTSIDNKLDRLIERRN